jgi:hypothetical protein
MPMIVYTVHEPERPAQSMEKRADGIVFIKEGFTWWGFLFGPLWLLFNRLWFELIAALLISAGVAAGLAQLELGDQAPGIVNLLLMLLVGFEGNDLRRWRLDRKGYAFLASVAGRDFEECERRFFDAWLPHIAGGRIGRPLAAPVMDPKPSASADWRGPNAIGTLPGA